MPAEPRTSFVLTCFNLGQYLPDAVESVLAQTDRDAELIVVDDGSTDLDTIRAIEALEARPSIRVVRSVNQGLPSAKNLGLSHARGTYVCMVDADDVLEPQYLARSVSTLEADPGLTFVSHWFRTFGDETWDWTPTDCTFPTLLDHNTLNGAALVRRTALEAVGGFDPAFRDGCEDWDMWITLVEHGYTGCILPEFLFRYRRRHDSMSRVMTRGGTHPRIYERLVRKHRDSYTTHLPALVARRDHDLSRLALHTHDLRLQRAQWLDPLLTHHRDDVRVLEGQAARVMAEREQVDTAARLTRELAGATEQAYARDADANRLQGELAATRDLVYTLDAAANRQADEVTQLRASLEETTRTLTAARDADRDAARRQVDLLTEALRHTVAESSALRDSWSWRITTPLRWLARVVQRGGR